jgi:hypothetical protein
MRQVRQEIGRIWTTWHFSRSPFLDGWPVSKRNDVNEREMTVNQSKREEIQKRERTTIDEARGQGIGEPEEGIDPAVPSYTDRGDVSDLGVDEPVVPRTLKGAPPPDTKVETDGHAG